MIRRYLLLWLAGALAPWSAAAQTAAIPSGTELLLRLDSTISSKTARPREPFSATVVSPGSHEGATVRGHVSKVNRSGSLKGRTEIGLEFDNIQPRGGRRTRLRADLAEIRQSESVKVVDEEGNIRSGSRGDQALKRGAIGAAIGGVLGGVLGGGKGALIGILAGGGVGAGSLVLQGAKELRLEPGTEMLIRTR
jgi:hypothetical protein